MEKNELKVKLLYIVVIERFITAWTSFGGFKAFLAERMHTFQDDVRLQSNSAGAAI
jgi:hypothetical protein